MAFKITAEEKAFLKARRNKTTAEAIEKMTFDCVKAMENTLNGYGIPLESFRRGNAKVYRAINNLLKDITKE
jgi:hypothetical protein